MEISAKWEYPGVSKEQKNLNHLMVKMQSPPDPSQKQRKPIALCMVIDKSWSMKGEKMDAVFNASSIFINWLTRYDFLGIVGYAEDVQIIQNMDFVKDKRQIIERLKDIRIGTSTNLSAGWLQGIRMLEEMKETNCIKRLILLTDGIATMGIQEDEKLVDIARSYYQKGIVTTTIGFGSDFNEGSLKSVAEAGNGNFHFIDNPEKITEVFYKEFQNVGSLYAQAGELRIQIPEGFRFLELLTGKSQPSVADGEVRFNIGDLMSDEERKVVSVFEIDGEVLSRNPQARNLPIEFKYHNVVDNISTEMKNITSFVEVSDARPDADTDVQLEVLLAQAGKAMIESSIMAQTDIDAASELLKNIKERIRNKMDLNPTLLEILFKRVDVMMKRLMEDSNMARKALLVSGSNLFTEHFKDDLMISTPIHAGIYDFETAGDLDLYNMPEVKSAIMNKIKKSYGYVVMDMKKTNFIDSSAIGGLIQISSWLKRRGGMLAVANLSNTVMKIFEMTQLNRYIYVASSVAQAKEKLNDIQKEA